MPNDAQGFDWEKIKTDPKLWMRLAMPMDKTNALGRVFKGEENPFQRDGDAAIERLKTLAATGQLYLREYGRSSHFRKVEMEKDQPKLTDRYELRLNGNTDPVAGFLMRLSRSYFKWIGINSISNWFDKRLKLRDERIEHDKRYREEFSTLSKAEKIEIKETAKQQKKEAKAQKKLDKLKKELEKAQEELNQIQGKDKGKTKGEMDSPLSQPPETEKQNSMQPTALGDQPVQNQLNSKEQSQLSQQQTVSHQITGKPKDEKKPESKTTDKEPDVRLHVDGVEYNSKDLSALPPEVKNALEVLTSFIAQQKQIESSLQKGANGFTIENTAQHEVLGSKPKADFSIDNGIRHEVLGNTQVNAPKVAVEGEVSKGNIPSPIEQPVELEPEKVSMQKQEPAPLQQRLEAEAQEMEKATNWKANVENALLSHEEAKSYRDNYNMIKDQGNLGTEYLAGAAFGVLSKLSAEPEKQQQVLDALLSGKSLGSGNDDLVSNGVSAYNRAIEQQAQGNKETMAEMLADSIRALSQQASRETGVSPRNVMIGKLIANAAAMATENNLELPLSDEEMAMARGATTMADLAVRYHNAQQYLGKEPMDLSSKTGKAAVRDLLAGKAIETMVRDNHKEGQKITATQMIMGNGMWDMENLLVMTRDSQTCQKIKPDQVKALLEKPDGFEAAKVAQNVTMELLDESMEIQKGVDEMMEKQLQNEEQLEQEQLQQPEINPLQGGIGG